MSCIPCLIIKALIQFFLNLLILADHALNTSLLGNPEETLSARIARARVAGHYWATIGCKCLSLMFFFMKRDHCTWALEKGTVDQEIWHWSPPD